MTVSDLAPDTRPDPGGRPVALVTGAGRRLGIATSAARRLAETGWDVAFTHFDAYDGRMAWGVDEGAAPELAEGIRACGARAYATQADFEDVGAPARVFDVVTAALGPVTALVLGHCESVDSGILDTDIESFDRHFAVNTRANWLLIREYARRLADEPASDEPASDEPASAEPASDGLTASEDSSGRHSSVGPAPDAPGSGQHGLRRIVALTSDHTAGNLPYGASKGALDRIVIAAARELAHLGVSANCVNPGPTDNGWLTDEQRTTLTRMVPLGRLSTPRDAANLIAFLCSPEGGWINGQLLFSNGGF